MYSLEIILLVLVITGKTVVFNIFIILFRTETRPEQEGDRSLGT